MKAIRTDATTDILGAPIGWDHRRHGPCEGLPVVRHDGAFYSYWRVGLADRVRILLGRPVRLVVAGEGHPPVAVDTEAR